MRFYLAALLIALVTTAGPYRVDMPQPLNAAPWSVWRGMGAEGNHLACTASVLRPDGIGVNLLKSAAGAWYIGTTSAMYGLKEQAQDPGATLTVDPGVLGRSLTVLVPALSMGEDITLLALPGSMTAWLDGLAAGHMARIVVNSKFVDFDLTGSAGAIDAIEKCHAFRRSYTVKPEDRDTPDERKA